MSSLPVPAFVFKSFISRLFITLVLLIASFFLIAASEPAQETQVESTEHPAPEAPKKTDRIYEPFHFPLDDETVKTTEEEADHFFYQFLKMLGTLGLLVFVMLAASWSLKRMLNTRMQQLNVSSSIKVVESRALSNKSSLHLIEVQDQLFVIGESSNNITLLTKLPTQQAE